MATPKKYFHDHLVLLLLSINAFLAVAGSIFILLSLSSTHGNVYYAHYRPILEVKAYKTGSVIDLLAFVVFALLVVAAHTILSQKAYRVHRQLALVILSLGVLLLILAIIISNALLALR